jgi:RimJ/RimL family protein N-acetyltransferase
VGWPLPDDHGITTTRLRLTTLVPDDADALVDVLADRRLHEFIGGEPADREELRARFERMVEGPASADERWCNWVLRRRADGQAVGTVQATLTRGGGRCHAEVAWVVGVPWQGQGFAGEAAAALVDWLQQHGVDRITANIHPDHQASSAVARQAGLQPTADEIDGETVWELGR